MTKISQFFTSFHTQALSVWPHSSSHRPCGCTGSMECSGRSMGQFWTLASRSLCTPTLSFSVLSISSPAEGQDKWSETKSALLPTLRPKVWKKIQPKLVKLPSQISTNHRHMSKPSQVSRSNQLICRSVNNKCYCCMLPRSCDWLITYNTVAKDNLTMDHIFLFLYSLVIWSCILEYCWRYPVGTLDSVMFFSSLYIFILVGS